MSVHDFPGIGVLEVGRSTLVTLGIDFNDTTQGAKMEILWATEVEPKKQTVTIKAPIGELIRPVTMSESLFIAEQGVFLHFVHGFTQLSRSITFVNLSVRVTAQSLLLPSSAGCHYWFEIISTLTTPFPFHFYNYDLRKCIPLLADTIY